MYVCNINIYFCVPVPGVVVIWSGEVWLLRVRRIPDSRWGVRHTLLLIKSIASVAFVSKLQLRRLSFTEDGGLKLISIESVLGELHV